MPSIKYEVGDNIYCGPAALSAITGLSVKECCKLIENEIGDQPIEGIYYPLLLKILTDLDYNFERTNFDKGFYRSGVFLICFKKHFGVLDNGIYYDNHYPFGESFSYKFGGKVETIWEITKR